MTYIRAGQERTSLAFAIRLIVNTRHGEISCPSANLIEGILAKVPHMSFPLFFSWEGPYCIQALLPSSVGAPPLHSDLDFLAHLKGWVMLRFSPGISMSGVYEGVDAEWLSVLHP